MKLFNGTFDNWKVGENAATFKTEDGMIVVNGPTAHLFYDGDYSNHDFRNFELKLDIADNAGIQLRRIHSHKIPGKQLAAGGL